MAARDRLRHQQGRSDRRLVHAPGSSREAVLLPRENTGDSVNNRTLQCARLQRGVETEHYKTAERLPAKFHPFTRRHAHDDDRPQVSGVSRFYSVYDVGADTVRQFCCLRS